MLPEHNEARGSEPPEEIEPSYSKLAENMEDLRSNLETHVGGGKLLQALLQSAIQFTILDDYDNFNVSFLHEETGTF
jgi:hypothetical protein